MRIEKCRTAYKQYRIPGLVMTDGGTLIAYYECRRDFDDWAQIDLKIIRSTDGGESWETVALIDGGGDTLNNPLMIADGGTVHFLYCRNYKRIYYRKSDDDGKSFSEPRDITYVMDAAGFYNAVAVGPGHGIVKDGALIAPVWIGFNREDPKKHSPTYVRTLFSRDGGESWALGGEVFREELVDANESALAVCGDEVLISIRHRGEKCRAFAKSATGVDGWRSLRLRRDLPDPQCQGSMFTDGGRIYHLNCADDVARVDLTLRVSDDGLETFDSILIDEAAGYADLAVRDGTAYVLYEKDTRYGGLYFKRIRL